AVADVGGCEEHLCGRKRRQRLVPGCLQPRLAERGGRLQPRDVARAAIEAEARQPQRDRTGGDDADGLTALDDLPDLLSTCAELRAPNAPARPRDEARPEFHDDGHRCCVPSPTTRYWRSHRSREVTGPRGPGAPP